MARKPKKQRAKSKAEVEAVREENWDYDISVPTPDDFYPTYEDGTVKVSVMRLPYPRKPETIRTCVWGGDDTGYDRDESFRTKKEARLCFERRVKEVNGWGIVTVQMLLDLGFVHA